MKCNQIIFWELQLGGPDDVYNLRFLHSQTNYDIGSLQIWPQIRNLESGTPITIRVLDVEGKDVNFD